MSQASGISQVASGETRKKTSGGSAALERGKPIRPWIETLERQALQPPWGRPRGKRTRGGRA